MIKNIKNLTITDNDFQGTNHKAIALADGSTLVAQAHRDSPIAVGDDVGLAFETAPLQLFDAAGHAYHAR